MGLIQAYNGGYTMNLKTILLLAYLLSTFYGAQTYTMQHVLESIAQPVRALVDVFAIQKEHLYYEQILRDLYTQKKQFKTRKQARLSEEEINLLKVLTERISKQNPLFKHPDQMKSALSNLYAKAQYSDNAMHNYIYWSNEYFHYQQLEAYVEKEINELQSLETLLLDTDARFNNTNTQLQYHIDLITYTKRIKACYTAYNKLICCSATLLTLSLCACNETTADQTKVFASIALVAGLTFGTTWWLQNKLYSPAETITKIDNLLPSQKTKKE